MAKVTRNLIGNFLGRGVAASLSLLLVPVYIRFLGVEAYGLVGFFLVLQYVFGFLDFGLSTTMHREIALRVADDTRRAEARDLLRTVESFYWPFGLVIGIVIAALAPLLARRWLHPETLSVATIQTAIVLMGVVTALQWPNKLYEGVLHGLQRIVAFNAITAGMQIVRAFGTVLAVWLWPKITVFFIAQMAVSALTVVLLWVFSWKFMPAGRAPHVKMALIRQVWKFAAGMTATAGLGIILSQSDRIVLSRMLPLETFGYYSVATTVALGLFYLSSPISLTVLPRFTELLAKQQYDDLARTYHLSAQLMTVVLTPVALALALFSREVIALWTRNSTIAERTSPVASVLIIAVLLYTITDIPYMLQLAQGRAKLAVYTNLVSVIIYIPMLIVMVRLYGLIGGAIPMLILQTAKFTIWGQFIHRYILPGQAWRWYVHDVAPPALAAAAVVILARLTIPATLFSFAPVGLLLLGTIVAVAAAASVAAAPLPRMRAFALLARFRERFVAVEPDGSHQPRGIDR